MKADALGSVAVTAEGDTVSGSSAVADEVELSKEGRGAGGLRLSDESMLASAGESVSMAASACCR